MGKPGVFAFITGIVFMRFEFSTGRDNRGYTILEDSRIGCVKPMTGCGKSKAITFWWVNSNANGASATVC